MRTLLLGFRSLLFYLGFITVVVIAGTLCCLLFFTPFMFRQKMVSHAIGLIMLWLRITCGIRIQIEGKENIPNRPCVILCNHQSTWETFFLQQFFPPLSVILKRELLWIPFFGWALFLLRPIAIKRANPGGAIRQVLKLGKQRLKEGNNIVIYPEGTRSKSGDILSFKTSGAAVAKAGKAPVLPIRHNAGQHWPVDKFIKTPGTINVVIGPEISTLGRDAREITEEARTWIVNAL